MKEPALETPDLSVGALDNLSDEWLVTEVEDYGAEKVSDWSVVDQEKDQLTDQKVIDMEARHWRQEQVNDQWEKQVVDGRAEQVSDQRNDPVYVLWAKQVADEGVE